MFQLQRCLSLFSFMISHSIVRCMGTRWTEPAIIWLAVAMPTGSGKSTLFKFLLGLVQEVRKRCKRKDSHLSWTLEESSFKKMGALMAENDGKLLGLYDELSAFLTGINLYNSKGLSDSPDLHKFLQLYYGFPWKRRTGMLVLRTLFAGVNREHVHKATLVELSIVLIPYMCSNHTFILFLHVHPIEVFYKLIAFPGSEACGVSVQHIDKGSTR